MIIKPEEFSVEIRKMLQKFIEDEAKFIPLGEARHFLFQFGDCVPFTVEVIGTMAEKES